MPDIENVWSVVKHYLRGKRIYTLKQLCSQIKKVWRSLPEQYAKNLVESMPKRCEAIKFIKTKEILFYINHNEP